MKAATANKTARKSNAPKTANTNQQAAEVVKIAAAQAPEMTEEANPEFLLRQAKEELKAKKEALRLKEWISEKQAKNPQFTGVSREVTSEDAMLHTHGSRLWEIRCAVCGTTRWVNSQDAHQVKYCEEHRKQASRDAAKKRRAKKNGGKSVEAQLAAVQAQLAKLENTES